MKEFPVVLGIRFSKNVYIETRDIGSRFGPCTHKIPLSLQESIPESYHHLEFYQALVPGVQMFRMAVKN